MSPGELAQRIERLYVAACGETGSSGIYGARAWWARQAGVTDATVSRWLAGRTEPGGPVLALLAALEREQGITS